MPKCERCNKITDDGTRWNIETSQNQFYDKYVCLNCYKILMANHLNEKEKNISSKNPTSGILLKCKKIFGQFLLTENPLCTINDEKTGELKWNTEFIISLEPETPYKITIRFPYLGSFCGTTSFCVKVKKGEIQKYEYTTPFFATNAGTIEYIQ